MSDTSILGGRSGAELLYQYCDNKGHDPSLIGWSIDDNRRICELESRDSIPLETCLENTGPVVMI